MMKIGFLGAGSVAQTMSRLVLPFGHQVVLSNGRGPRTLDGLVKELGAGASAGTPQEAAEQDIVILAVMWPAAEAALAAVPDWKNRILVDATNRVSPQLLGNVSGRSSSEIISDRAPGAKVVKVLNTVPMAWIAKQSSSAPRTVLFVSGDDVASKQPIRRLLEQVGFACIDLGSLAVGGRLQQLGGPLAGVKLTLAESVFR